MNIFEAALKSITPHFRVRGHTLLITQGDKYIQVDLQKVAAHRMPSVSKIQIRLFRGRWTSYSVVDFRPREVRELRRLLTHWEKENHKRTSA